MERSWRFVFVAVSVAGIWVSVLLASLLAPNLVTGSQHESIPLVAMTSWLWGLCATGFVLLAGLSHTSRREHWIGAATAMVVIWAVIAVLSIYAPVLVTGTDPTRIPLVALLSPIAGVIATGYVCIFAALAAEEPVVERNASGVTIDVLRHGASS
ncbi:MAG TPA: hypothetical protein VIH19_06740 [Candidatus Limnocylindria bacterium]|jgi:hypothetical protein